MSSATTNPQVSSALTMDVPAGRQLERVVKSTLISILWHIQLGPVKSVFIGVASWRGGRDAQIALIKNPLRALAKALPLAGQIVRCEILSAL